MKSEYAFHLTMVYLQEKKMRFHQKQWYVWIETSGMKCHPPSPQILLCRAASQTPLILPWLRGSTLHLHLLNLMRFPWAYFLNLSRSLWMVFHLPSASAEPLSFMPSGNLLRVNSILSFMPLIKILGNTGPCLD